MALIVVQAGHYPRKTGATGTGGLDGDPTEQEFTIAAANACAVSLRAVGHQCRVIWADVDSDQYRGDAFVAIHCDGSTNPSARGASVGYRTTLGADMAARFKRHYQAQGWTGGWRPDNYTKALAGYYGTKRAVEEGNRAAFIAEAGFLTNAADEKLLTLPAGPQRFARALTAAVVERFGQPHQEDDMPLTSKDKAVIVEAIEDAVEVGGKARDDLKTLFIGALGHGLSKPPDGRKPEPGEGDLRPVFKGLLTEWYEEQAVTIAAELGDQDPPAG